MKNRFLRGLFLTAAAILGISAVGLAGYVALKFDPPPLAPGAISGKVDRINEGAGVIVPHKSLDDGKTRAQHLELFQQVESGAALSQADSDRYRVIYQELLARHQRFLSLFDGNLTVLHDVGMSLANNVHGKGIDGSHDHHDASARSNFRDMRDAMARVASAGGPLAWFVRIKNAVSANKDLMDILLHLATAPQTKSVPYMAPAVQPGDPIEAMFEDVLREFKLAQFEPVNSPGYNAHIVLALNHYDRLVRGVQDAEYAHLGPLERTLAGTWSGWQALSPDADSYQATRISRAGKPLNSGGK